MFKGNVLCVSRSNAIQRAADHLIQIGIPVASSPGPDITHLLLPVPSFSSGDTYLAHLLTDLPDDVIVSGGMLHSPLLERYRTVDFLKDPFYLAENAAITAECTLKLIYEHIPTLEGSSVLLLGWGRIGKCLGQHLRQQGADVTITARKTSDIALIHALGYGAAHTGQVSDQLMRYQIIINTIPELILPNIKADPAALLIELASKPGMTGSNILIARGLPGKMAPEESGKLIAETFIRLSI